LSEITFNIEHSILYLVSSNVLTVLAALVARTVRTLDEGSL